MRIRIDDAPGVLFEVETSGLRPLAFAAHALAHLQDFGPQRLLRPAAGQDLGADGLKA
jgi:hypothetical protein